MKIPRRRNSARWDERPRSQRKLGFIRMKNEIARHADRLGGLFHTHDVILGSSWADVYFLSRMHRHRVYNATVDSALHRYFDKCEDLAMDASERLHPFDAFDFDERFVKGEDGLFTLSDAPERQVEAERRAFGGLTRFEWVDREKARLADSGEVWVSPGVELDFDYRYGVGLMATLDCEKLEIDTIDRFVAEFLDGGEVAGVDESKRLSFPSSRAKESMVSNPISDDPSEWAPSLASRRLATAESQAIEAELGASAEAGAAEAARRL